MTREFTKGQKWQAYLERKRQLKLEREQNQPIVQCECGCGQTCRKGKRFLRGHYARTMTTEQHNKISATLRERGIKPPGTFGLKFGPRSEEVKRKISEAVRSSESHKAYAQRLKKERKADDNPAWRGGRSKIPYSHNWTHEFKETFRDEQGRFCHICWTTENSRGYNFDVHHIDGDKKNIDRSNFIVLCHSCHQRITGSTWMMKIVELPDGSTPMKIYDSARTQADANAKRSSALKGIPKSPEHADKLREIAASRKKYASPAEKCRGHTGSARRNRMDQRERAEIVEMLKALESVRRQWQQLFNQGKEDANVLVIATLSPRELSNMMSSITSRP